MSRTSIKDRLRALLTFANVVSLLALFVALGGSAYAVGVLPANSVGRLQLQANSVTSSKLAHNSVGRWQLRANSVTTSELVPGSVGLNALDPTLRAMFAQGATETKEGSEVVSGAQGPEGPRGPAGIQGPGGPSAIRVHYFAHASASPSSEPAIAVAGFHVDAECQASGPGTQLQLSANTTEAGTFTENINTDGGPGQASMATASSSNLQANLPAGTTVLGGPAAATGEYSRIFVQAIYVTPKSTVELTIVLLLDGTNGTCAIDGVGVPATS